jgi:hypothetical protein
MSAVCEELRFEGLELIGKVAEELKPCVSCRITNDVRIWQGREGKRAARPQLRAHMTQGRAQFPIL